MNIRTLTLALTLLAAPTTYAAEYEAVACQNQADAESIQNALLGEVSLQAGADTGKSEAFIDALLAKQACHTVALDQSSLTILSTTLHQEGGAQIGVARVGQKYAVIVDFENSVLGGI